MANIDNFMNLHAYNYQIAIFTRYPFYSKMLSQTMLKTEQNIYFRIIMLTIDNVKAGIGIIGE